MISGRRGAPGRLGAYFNNIPGVQLGIGYYESVGADAPPAAVPSHPPQVVSAPEPAINVQRLMPEQRGALDALAVMGFFGTACLAAWAGYSLTHGLRRKTS